MTSLAKNSGLPSALPFWAAFVNAPLFLLAAYKGGWFIALIPLYGVYLSSALDRVLGRNTDNPDPLAEHTLNWHRLVTILWWPVQLVVVFGGLLIAARSPDISTAEFVLLAMACGTITGGTGIVFAHELMHQKPAGERMLGDALMTMVLYGHFRSEHLLVHHRYVGTPRDAVTARYNEGMLRFFPRVLVQSFASAWRTEAARLAQRNRPVWHLSNPFWRYALWSIAYVLLAALLAGWAGVGFFVFQAFIAILFLETVDYVEHYGLTRKHLGDGKYEHVKPHHSWNADHRFTNYLLINLQRHSDHHYKPARRFPLLQTYKPEDAPLLPYGYPLMVAMALVPPLWFRVMNPRVRAWRRQYYPEIEDWSAYKAGTNPMPR